MKIAVLTFDAFNEIDSFVSAALLNRLSGRGWRAYITGATDQVTSRNGIVVEAQKPLDFVGEADAVIFGSGMKTDEIAGDPAMLARMNVDPARQLLAGQCSGALIMSALGLFSGEPVCTDLTTEPLLTQQGLYVSDQAFHALGNVATAGGCLASQYIAAWIIGRGLGIDQAATVIRHAAPVGQQDEYVSRAIATVSPFLTTEAGCSAVSTSNSRSV
ncbi:DJ-1/PfpI family protein [Paraburkholderia sediminicola]|uniref:AraC family transcriptional regulator n=1 Tax=Paraburkholderia TaxID=1822464 RepID=UPI0038BA2692